MNTTKATLAGHWERHQPGANEINRGGSGILNKALSGISA
jgi:hypothetical protein